MLDKIECDKVYTNRDDAEFIFTVKSFGVIHLRGRLDSRFDHIPSVIYMEHEGNSLCVMPEELFKEQFRLVTDEENYLKDDENV